MKMISAVLCSKIYPEEAQNRPRPQTEIHQHLWIPLHLHQLQGKEEICICDHSEMETTSKKRAANSEASLDFPLSFDESTPEQHSEQSSTP